MKLLKLGNIFGLSGKNFKKHNYLKTNSREDQMSFELTDLKLYSHKVILVSKLTCGSPNLAGLESNGEYE